MVVMVAMIGESRWTGTTLKFGLNIEQSLGTVWWRVGGQPRLLGHPPPLQPCHRLYQLGGQHYLTAYL